jgi:hypothetical protein
VGKAVRADPKKPEDLAGLKTKPFAFEVAGKPKKRGPKKHGQEVWCVWI